MRDEVKYTMGILPELAEKYDMVGKLYNFLVNSIKNYYRKNNEIPKGVMFTQQALYNAGVVDNADETDEKARDEVLDTMILLLGVRLREDKPYQLAVTAQFLFTGYGTENGMLVMYINRDLDWHEVWNDYGEVVYIDNMPKIAGAVSYSVNI